MQKTWSLSILLFAASVLGHSSVQAFDASEPREPAAETCVIYVPKQEPNRDKNWQALGFQVKALPEDLSQMSSADFSNLLARGEFALREDKKEIWFSLGKAGVVENWKPLSIRAPEKGSAPSSSYSCKNLKSQMSFFKEGRRAIQEAYSLVQGKSTDRKIGDTFIDLERVFFLHQSVSRFDFAELHKRYGKLLSATQKIRSKNILEFFEQWTEVRRLVYAKEKFNIAYCRDKTSIAEALLENCTNCVGETFLLYALFKDAGFEAPAGWKLGLQSFSDHLRLVLYDEKNQKLHDLATGKFDAFRAAIYPAESFPLSLLAGHSALKLDSEKSWIQAQSPVAVYKAWGCKLPGVGLRPSLQPSDLNIYSACDRYSPDSPPEHASNDSKTELPSEAKDRVQSSSGRSASDSSSNSSSWFGSGLSSAIGLSWNGVSGFFSTAPTWYEYLITNGPFDSKDSSKQFLALYAEGLNSEERKILLDGLEKKTADRNVVTHFSQGSLMARLGYSHYVNRQEMLFVEKDPYLAWHWNSPLLPLHIYQRGNPMAGTNSGIIRALGPDDYDENGNIIDSNAGTDFFCDIFGKNCKMKIHSCNDSAGTCLRISDPSLFAQMSSLSAVERMAKLLSLFKESFSRSANLEYKDVSDLIAQAPARLRSSQLSSLKQDLQAFLQLYSSQTLMSDWGIKNRDDRGLAPLRDALTRSVGLENFARIYNYQSGFVKAVSESTVTSLKEMDKLSKADKEALKYHFAFLRGLIYGLNNFRKAPAFKAVVEEYERNPDVDIQLILASKTLHHPEYYFTVVPDADERVPGRPYSPWQIQDPRVQDMKKSVNQLRLPKVNLPTISAVNNCAPGEKGYKAIKGFYILCGADGPDSDDKTYDSRWKQNGIVSNPNGGDVVRNIRGQDDRLVETGVRNSKYGFESQGKKPFHREMKDSERKLPSLSHYAEVVPDGNASADAGLLDPRQEVHLQPDTWSIFITPDTTQYLEGSDFILLHHAYRKKLAEVFAFPKLIPWEDYEDNVLSLPGQVFRRFAEIYLDDTCDSRCKNEILDDFWGRVEAYNRKDVAEPAFVNIAKQELQNPKSGWVVSTTAEVEISDEDLATAYPIFYQKNLGRSDWNSSPKPTSIPRGIRLPVIARESGIEYPVLTSASPYLRARSGHSQILKQQIIEYIMSAPIESTTLVVRSEDSGKYDFALAPRELTAFKGLGPMTGIPYSRQNIHKLFDGLAKLRRVRETESNPKLRALEELSRSQEDENL